MRPSTPAVRLAAALAAALLAPAARAQFERTEVSPRGRTPFLIAGSASSHEDLVTLAPRATYNVYRRKPGDSFRCIAANRVDPNGWTGDPESPPPGEVWLYHVTADDSWGENLHGSTIDIVEPCACSGLPPATGKVALKMELIAWGLFQPTFLTHPPGERARLFYTGKTGLVSILNRGKPVTTPFLDLVALTQFDSERGLASMAFHPDYARNGRFFVFYTEKPAGDIVVAEYRVSATDPNVADPATRREILREPHPGIYHNGGQIAFGPNDGYLYIALGDGGDDCELEAGSPGNLKGKIIRIDVDGADPYAIPPTNPFVGDGDPDTRDEIWAYGLRNPWRFSFDPLNGDLYIGDVGRVHREEVDWAPGTSVGGENYGWPCVEGNLCNTCALASCACPPDPALTPPVFDYDHITGCAVLGGYVYRGCRLPDYHGTYWYADACNHANSFEVIGGVATNPREWTADFGPGGVAGPASWGVDQNGEIYLVNIWIGQIYRIEPLAIPGVVALKTGAAGQGPGQF